MKLNFFSQYVKLLKEKSGHAAVEFAITFPVLIFVTLAIFDIGRGIFFYTSVHNVAAETVRFASVRGVDSPTRATLDEVEAFALARATGLDQDNLTVTVEYTPDDSSGSTVEVTVDYDMRFYLGAWVDTARITLTGSSQMEIL